MVPGMMRVDVGVAQGLVDSGMAAVDGVWALNVAAYANPR